GDVILEFNGKPVADSRHLKLQVARIKPGDKVTVKLLRSGSTKSLEVTVNELPGTDKLAQNGAPSGNDSAEALKGVAVGDLSPELRHQFKIPSGVKGAVVTDVEDNAAA